MALEGRERGEAKSDIEIMSLIFTRLRKMYQDEGGKLPRSHRQPVVAVFQPAGPTAEELAQEIYSGKALADLADPKDPRPRSRARPASSWPLAELRDDGSTASGCWIFAGAWSPAGNLMARRDNRSHRHRPDPELGLGVAGQPPHSLQPRVL